MSVAAQAERRAEWWSTRGIVVLAILATNIPVLEWYGTRLRDGGDEPWGLLALALALLLAPRESWRRPLSAGASWLVAGCVGFATLGAAAGWVPPLVHAGLVAVALGVALGSGPGAWGRCGLLLLSLPVLATVQFYAGYPLRVLTAEISRWLLWIAGTGVERAGVLLRGPEGSVVVDAPCSGVAMLWTGAVLASALAAWHRLSARAAVRLALGAALVVLVANGVRAALLYFVETGAWPAADWVHLTIGLLVFGGGTGCISGFAARMKGAYGAPDTTFLGRADPWRRLRERGWIESMREVVQGFRWGAIWGNRTLTVAAVWAACFVAAVVTLVPETTARPTPARVHADFPGWPETFEGKPWIRRLRSVTGEAFRSNFPGEVGVFDQEGRTVVLRWVAAPSRGLHPAGDCFRAIGGEVGTAGLVDDASGIRWSEFSVAHDDATITVRERIHDRRGRNWTDVSAWYWAAIRGKTQGPWWAVTVIEKGARSGK